MEAATAALIGAAIGGSTGAVGAIVAAWITQRQQTKRDLVKMAVDAGLAEHRAMLEQARLNGKSGAIPPVATFITIAADTLRLIAEGHYTPEKASELDAKSKAHVVAAYERNKK